MASSQVMLLLLCGEIWSCLCAAVPATTERHTSSSATGPGAHRPLLYQVRASEPSPAQPESALAVTQPLTFPGEEEQQEEAGDGSWVAALILGMVLLGMVLAVVTILLWKCRMRPVLTPPHWAGRSPFADGDTPDLLTDPEQGSKRSSAFAMLPWRLKQGTALREEPSVSENQSQHSTSTENGQPPAAGTAPAPEANPVPAPEANPAPAPEAASTAAASCPPPDTPAQDSELPPPPDWLREPTEEPSSDPSSDPSTHSALHWEAEEPQPPPPELLIQDTQETLPQPQHPL